MPRRELIIRALFEVIYHRGVDGVSMRAVAEAAQVSVGAIQHHFGSREQLIIAGCRAIVAGAEAAHRERSQDAAPLQTLRSIVASPIPRTQQFRIGVTVWFAYLAKATSNPDIGTLLLETAVGTHRECVRLLDAAGVSDGTSTATRLLALGEGLGQRVLIGALSADEALGLLDAELATIAGRA